MMFTLPFLLIITCKQWGYNLLRYGNISGQIDTAGVNSTTAVAAWNVVEVCFVFLPYVIFRPLFPTTRFKTAIANEKNKTEANVRFYRIGTQLIKVHTSPYLPTTSQ